MAWNPDSDAGASSDLDVPTLRTLFTAGSNRFAFALPSGGAVRFRAPEDDLAAGGVAFLFNRLVPRPRPRLLVLLVTPPPPPPPLELPLVADAEPLDFACALPPVLLELLTAVPIVAPVLLPLPAPRNIGAKLGSALVAFLRR